MLSGYIVMNAIMGFIGVVKFALLAYLAFCLVCAVLLVLLKGYDRIRYYTGAYYKYTKRAFCAVNRRDGSRCEYATYNRLRKLEREGYRFMFGLYIPKKYGGTTEIDMLAIGPQGVIAIECKDYSGLILGEEEVDTWIQDKRKGASLEDRYRKFYNPIMQNDGHIKHLREFVPAPTWIQSLIVFDNHSILENNTITRKDVSVVNVRGARTGIKKLTARIRSTPMTKKEIKELEAKLKPFTRVSKQVKRQHVLDVQQIAAANYR